MSLNNSEVKERIYLPTLQNGINAEEYLIQYIQREFPDPKHGKPAIYSIPRDFQKFNGEKQANLAEHKVFNRLQNIDIGKNNYQDGRLWITFFYSACYAGQSFHNQRVGKLIIREHDFVVFAKYDGKFFVILMEVKSTHDQATDGLKFEKVSDAKEIKNNKRSAQHQLRDHIEVLQSAAETSIASHDIKCFIMWPFLGAYTKDPRRQLVRRWKEDNNLHVFEDTISSQEKFNEWFYLQVLNTEGTEQAHFTTLLNRFIILSCGVFVNEINQGMMALLTQEQHELLYNKMSLDRKHKPLVVHGAAGTGKTLLVLKKLQQLYENGELNNHKRALYICYWPGIRFQFDMRLEAMGIKDYVDTARFYISLNDFLKDNKKAYKHVFMDEAEAICLAFDKAVIHKTFAAIYSRYHDGNCTIKNCGDYILQTNEDLSEKLTKHDSLNTWGELWFLVDINQASMFLPKHSPAMLKQPTIILNKIMRSTGYVFNFFKQFYNVPMPLLPKEILDNMHIPSIIVGHHIYGPPVYWVSLKNSIDKAVTEVVIDLCSTKGIKPNDLCVLPFLVNERLTPESINKYIDEAFLPKGYRPKGINNVEYFLANTEVNSFLIPWTLRVKGLEFKVVIMAIDGDDFDFRDHEDRKKAYIIASRSTTILIIVADDSIRENIDAEGNFQTYPFSMKFKEDKTL